MNENREKNEIIISQKYLHRIIAILLIAFLFVFIAGYYFGKLYHVEELSQRFDESFFSDKISFSLSELQNTEQSMQDVHEQ